MKKTKVIILMTLCMLLSGCGEIAENDTDSKSDESEMIADESESLSEDESESTAEAEAGNSYENITETKEDSQAEARKNDCVELVYVDSAEIASLQGIVDELEKDFDRNGIMDKAIIVRGDNSEDTRLLFVMNGQGFEYPADISAQDSQWIIQVEAADIDNDGCLEIIFNYDRGGAGGTGCQYVGILKFQNNQLYTMQVPMDNEGHNQGPGIVVEVRTGQGYSEMDAYCPLLDRSITFNGEYAINKGFLPNDSYEIDVANAFAPGDLYGYNSGGYYRLLIVENENGCHLWAFEGLTGYYARAEQLGDVAFEFEWDKKGNATVTNFVYFESEIRESDFFRGLGKYGVYQDEDESYFVEGWDVPVDWYGDDGSTYAGFVTREKYPAYYVDGIENRYAERNVLSSELARYDMDSLKEAEAQLQSTPQEFSIGQDVIPCNLTELIRQNVIYNEKGIYYINYEIRISLAISQHLSVMYDKNGNHIDVPLDSVYSYGIGEYVIENNQFVLQDFYLGKKEVK